MIPIGTRVRCTYDNLPDLVGTVCSADEGREEWGRKERDDDEPDTVWFRLDEKHCSKWHYRRPEKDFAIMHVGLNRRKKCPS